MDKKPARKRLNLNRETVAGLKNLQVATAIKAGLRPAGTEPRTNFYSPLPNVCC
jgi:hypothetical protein